MEKQKRIVGIRHLIFLLLFSSVILCFGVRTVLSVAILAMTDSNPKNPEIPTYPSWNNTDVMLSSFFWGYILPQIGAGQLIERFGPKWFLFSTTILGAVANIIVPSMAASMGSWGVIACRVLQGLSQGFLFPSIHNLLSKWTPLAERTMVASFIYGGAGLGIVVAMVLTGTISDSSWGWPGAFYIYGALLLAWTLLWGVFGANTPADHAMVPLWERGYIEAYAAADGAHKMRVPTPWMDIVTSLPMWAVLAAYCGQCWGTFTLLTEIPSYMKNIMLFNLKDNGLLSALPFLTLWVMSLVGAPIADWLISRRIIAIGTARKIFNSIGCFIPAACLIGLTFMDQTQKFLALGFLVVGVGATAGPLSGYLVNVLDLAPNHVGTLIGITNSIANVFSILGPLTVNWIGLEKTDPMLWTIVFYLAAGIYLGTGIFYLVFASGDIQPWNDIEKEVSE